MNFNNTQDSDGPERVGSNGQQTKKALFYKGVYLQASFLLLAGIALVFPPMVSQASFLSAIIGEKAEAEGVSAKNLPNSQTIALLEASAAVDQSDVDATDGVSEDGLALVPETGPSITVADVAVNPDTDQISLYVVKSGDTISSIAKMFGVSTNTIRWANDLVAGQAISEGTVLTILPVSGVEHTITKSDTLKKIAAKYGADISDIASFNGITEGTVLEVGSTVIVPNGSVPAPVVEKKPEAKPAANKAKSLAVSTSTQSSLPETSGYYIRPIVGGVKSQGLHDKYAIDLAAPIGTPIVASAAGTVYIADGDGYNGGYGKYVVIKHANGTQTLYAHMSRVAAEVGATVARGEVIGYVGSTGRSTGPHVHFEVRGAKNPGATKGVWER